MATRRVLGDMSPNVLLASPNPKTKDQAGGKLARPLNSAVNKSSASTTSFGSPLKRSFTAALEVGTDGGSQKGLMYLKRRRLSGDEALSEVVEEERSQGSSASVSRSLFRDGSRAGGEILSASLDGSISQLPAMQHPSPTEPNTPSSQGSCKECEGSQEADRRSFSSLINYDPSSQQALSQVNPMPARGVSRAEMLRLRLKVAMYKVRTSQTHLSFAELESAHPPDIDANGRATNAAVEAAVAELRREAQLDLAKRQARMQTIPSLDLLSAPVLRPTAYSSRMINQTNSLPSSPPDKLEVVWPVDMIRTATPLRAGGTDNGGDLTSSVVKGRVAEGLLGLRHAV